MKNFIRKTLLNSLYPFCYPSSNLNGYAVLMYHRIVQDKIWQKEILPELSVKVSDFEKQIEYLNKNFTCISLTEMCQRIKDGKRPDQLYFSITFDDGYADNYKFGYPILHKYRNKATIFVTTEYVNDNSISPYWDEIKEYSNTTHGKINFQDRNGDILDFNLSSLKGKRNFINTVNNMIFSNKLSIKDLSRIIKSKKANNQKRNNDFFTWNLLKKALASGNYEVGSHTKTHPILGILDDNGKDEIENSKQILENKLQSPVTHFSYPYGSGIQIITPEVISNIKNARFVAAFTNILGINKENTDKYLLKRIPVLGGESLKQLKTKIILADKLALLKKYKNALNI